MEKDVLVILMIAFGIFAIVMFILFYVYLKKYYNSKHIEDDYASDLSKNEIEEDMVSPSQEDDLSVDKSEEAPIREDNNVSSVEYEDEIDEGFIPIKKK